MEELRDIYSAEKQLVKALPKLAKAASNPTLRAAIEDHLSETEGQVARLETIFESLGEKATGKKCKGMEGLIKEGDEMAEEEGEDAVRDAGIISAAQRVEHYEMAAYGCVITYARMLGYTTVVSELEDTLAEENATDARLTELAVNEVNKAAMEAGAEIAGD